MKKLTIGIATVLCFVLATLILKGTPGIQETELQEFVPNEVLIKFKQDTAYSQIKDAIESLQGRIITNSGKEIATTSWDPRSLSKRSFLLSPDTFHLKIPEDVGTKRALEILKENPNIEYAEENSISRVCVDPNDTRFGELWGLKNTGQTGGTVDADIDAPEAWDIYTGSADMVVAVIDTGINYNHIDLQANIWINMDEIPANGLDDDGNGYVDDIRGWNFPSNNNNPMDDYYPAYHGTHVAGTIGATGNNGQGVVGVNWNVKLMAVKAGDSGGGLTAANIAKGIEYAVINGAKVSNNSYGGTAYSQTVVNAIQQALSAGQLFVAAAGNYPQFPQRDNDETPIYPASYNLANIVAVLATNHFDNLPTFSHYGKTSVDLGAPGGTNNPAYPSGNILSTQTGNGYQQLYGTSMATPHVAGVAALARGKCPLISYAQLKSRLLSKVDVLASLNNKCVSNGRLNAYKVIFDASQPNAPTNLSATPTGWNTIRLNWQDNSDNEIGFELQRKRQGEPDYTSLTVTSANMLVADDGAAVAGTTHFYRLRGYNMAGTSVFANETSTIIPTGAPYEPMNPAATWDWTRHAVHLTWDDMCNNEQYFIIERKQEGETEWQQVGELYQNWTFYYDEGVSGDRYYYYRIKAINPTGYSYSEQVQIYVPSWGHPF